MKLITTFFILFAAFASETRAQNVSDSIPSNKPKVIRASPQDSKDCGDILAPVANTTGKNPSAPAQNEKPFVDKVRLYTDDYNVLIATYTQLSKPGAKDQTNSKIEVRKISSDLVVVQVVTKGREKQVSYSVTELRSGLAYQKQNLIDQYGITDLTKPITYEVPVQRARTFKDKDGIESTIVSLAYDDPMEPKRRAYAEAILLEQLVDGKSTTGLLDISETFKFASKAFQSSNMVKFPKKVTTNDYHRGDMINPLAETKYFIEHFKPLKARQ